MPEKENRLAVAEEIRARNGDIDMDGELWKLEGGAEIGHWMIVCGEEAADGGAVGFMGDCGTVNGGVDAALGVAGIDTTSLSAPILPLSPLCLPYGDEKNCCAAIGRGEFRCLYTDSQQILLIRRGDVAAVVIMAISYI